jgi:hypothetical protein
VAYWVALRLLFLVTVVCSVCQLQNDKYGRQFFFSFFQFVNLRFRACPSVSVAPSYRYLGFVGLDVPFCLRSVCLSIGSAGSCHLVL